MCGWSLSIPGATAKAFTQKSFRCPCVRYSFGHRGYSDEGDRRPLSGGE